MRKINVRKLFATVIFAVVVVAGNISCLDTKPKVLKKKFSFDDEGDPTSTTVAFDYAYRNTLAAAPLNTVFYLQGSVDTKTTFISMCNLAGTSCVCEFLNSSKSVMSYTDATLPVSEIAYDSRGNYFRCEYTNPDPAEPITDVAYVRLRNQNSSVVSEAYEVLSSLTAQKLLGSSLDYHKMRTVYRYTCNFNFLQKDNTTTSSFDCSSGANCGGGAGDFCLLQSALPYYLYSDGYSNNFSDRPADLLYGPSGSICGIQIKQYDCAGGTLPTADFSLYGERAGIYETPVQLSAAPSRATGLYGFAAKTVTATIGGASQTFCPPGLEMKTLFTATTNTAGFVTASNYPNATTISEISDPTVVPANLSVSQVTDGDCSGTACTLPTTAAGVLTSFVYSIPVGQDSFCVIPDGI